MYVNAFWLGILLTLVGFVIVFIIIALVASHKAAARAEAELEESGMVMSEEEFRSMIEDAVRESADKVLREKTHGGKDHEN